MVLDMDFDKIAALLAFCIVAAATAGQANAVGIVWSTEREIVSELSPHCIEYGVYNPSGADATVQLSVSDSLKPVVQGASSRTEAVAAGTTHDKAVVVNLCFQVPKVYDANCLAGDFLCEQACAQDEVSYAGEVMALELNDEQGGGIGSQTTVGASVPLTLRVKCNPYGRDWSPVYLLVAAVAVAGIAGRMYMKRGRKAKAPAVAPMTPEPAQARPVKKAAKAVSRKKKARRGKSK
ncbi:MAG: hypothetical protein V1813_01945 [Candidatus Aenigmatarchaeota archaeon]